MSKDMRYFMQLVNAAIHGKPAPAETQIDWEQIFRWAEEQNLQAVMYQCVKELPDGFGPDEQLQKKWQNKTVYIGIMQACQNAELYSLIDSCTKENIWTLPFKGVFLAAMYPEPLLRASGDLDILILKEQADRARKLVESRGYHLVEDETLETVFVYNKDMFIIELHTCLWEELYGERAMSLKNMSLTEQNSYQNIRIEGKELQTLGVQEFLIYQIYHIAKHFSISGMGIRHLTDLALYVNKNIEQLDIKAFWASIQKLNYTTFCDYIFKICTEYFEMTDSILLPTMKKIPIKEDNLIKDCFEGGVFGLRTTDRRHARNIIRPYLENTEKVPDGHLLLVTDMLFPNLKYMKEQYPYLKKHILLLPIAWVQRVNFLIRKKLGRNSKAYNMNVIKEAEYRLKLLQELKLIDE